jgi:hypothetical protein
VIAENKKTRIFVLLFIYLFILKVARARLGSIPGIFLFRLFSHSTT